MESPSKNFIIFFKWFNQKAVRNLFKPEALNHPKHDGEIFFF